MQCRTEWHSERFVQGASRACARDCKLMLSVQACCYAQQLTAAGAQCRTSIHCSAHSHAPCLSESCLQEESRRLQLQSQVLQQRAMEMSMRMTSSGSGSRPAAPPAPAVVPLSQVSDLQAAMAAAAGIPQGQHGGAAGDSSGYSPQQYEAPVSQANSVLDAEAYMQAQGDANSLLVPPEGLLPRHPPGDVTPSSVTSSRAGLHWNIPSRGSIPSPGKVDQGYGSPVSRGDPRYVQFTVGLGSWLVGAAGGVWL